MAEYLPGNSALPSSAGNLKRVNPHRCRAIGLTSRQGQCLLFVDQFHPNETTLKIKFFEEFPELIRKGLIQNDNGVFVLSQDGKKKLSVLLKGS
ncbi:hypothetical protein [Anaerolinea sp.]|uniref:hypothetical protein n=1 Tax=Anaerolinea sp. TaxID=1872519 RepID=UPI002ACE345A|nr:hypothetical protein [Anaerolinea sp.]